MNASQGKLVIISGPSGAGKSTVVQRLLEDACVPLVRSVSATTRPRRKGERDGREYHFLSREAFQDKRRRGEFLECKEVFGLGQWYGTLEGEVTAGLNAGKWVLLEIDVQGTISVLKQFPHAITLFIHPGALSELETRLSHRGSESPASMARRLEVAQQEMAEKHRYKYEVINDSVERAVTEIQQILILEKQD